MKNLPRIGLLAVAALLGVLMVGMSTWSHVGVKQRANELARGQGDVLGHRVQDALEAGRSMDGTVTALADQGLVWAAIVGPGGVVLDEAGARSEGGQLPGPEERFVDLGDTVRVFLPPEHPPHESPGPPSAVVLEYEPTYAAELEQRSAGVMVVSGTSAAILLWAASLFWIAWRRAEAAELEMARTRHLTSLGQVSAVLAHEIKNPLAALKGHAQLLEEGLEGPRLERAQRVVREAERLEALTRSLLAFARTAQLDPEPTDVGALCRAFSSDDVTVTGQATWTLDPERMRRVLANLIDNGRQAGGPVTVDIDAGATLALRVRDHGPGVPADERERIFEPFHTTRSQGTGLGLAVVRRIVHLHGGTVTVLAHPDGGAVFLLELPEGPWDGS